MRHNWTDPGGKKKGVSHTWDLFLRSVIHASITLLRSVIRSMKKREKKCERAWSHMWCFYKARQNANWRVNCFVFPLRCHSFWLAHARHVTSKMASFRPADWKKDGSRANCLGLYVKLSKIYVCFQETLKEEPQNMAACPFKGDRSQQLVWCLNLTIRRRGQ